MVFCVHKNAKKTVNKVTAYDGTLQGWFWAAKQTNTDRVGSDFAYAQFQVLSSTEVRPICPAVRIVQLSTDFGTIRNCLAKLST